MAAATNVFTLVGNISQPIELRTTKSGKKFAFISIAVRSGVSDDVDFISFCIWEKLAENVMKYCNKGDGISVLGHISIMKRDEKTELMLTGDAVSFLHKAAKKEEPKAEPKEETTPEEPKAEPKEETTPEEPKAEPKEETTPVVSDDPFANL